jgi:hypothetical protein
LLGVVDEFELALDSFGVAENDEREDERKLVGELGSDSELESDGLALEGEMGGDGLTMSLAGVWHVSNEDARNNNNNNNNNNKTTTTTTTTTVPVYSC